MPKTDDLRAALEAFERISADPDNDSNDAVEDAAHELAGEVRELLTTVTGSDLRPSTLLPDDRANFNTLMRAVENDDVFLLHAREKATGHGHALICIKSRIEGSDDVDVILVARMLDGDPYESYTNPAED